MSQVVPCEPYRQVLNLINIDRFLGRTARFPYEITVYDPPKRWGFRAVSGPLRPAAVLSFSSRAEGTLLESELQVPGPLGFLVGQVLLAQQRANYQRLKELLEAGTI